MFEATKFKGLYSRLATRYRMLQGDQISNTQEAILLQGVCAANYPKGAKKLGLPCIEPAIGQEEIWRLTSQSVDGTTITTPYPFGVLFELIFGMSCGAYLEKVIPEPDLLPENEKAIDQQIDKSDQQVDKYEQTETSAEYLASFAPENQQAYFNQWADDVMDTLRGRGLDEDHAKQALMHFAGKVGNSIHGPNLGEWLLGREQIDEKVRVFLAELRSDNVRDEDFREWWNLHPFLKESYIGIVELDSYLIYQEAVMNETDESTAITIAFRLPRFANPHSPHYPDVPDWNKSLRFALPNTELLLPESLRSSLTSDDRPLPVELYPLVSRFLTVEEQHMEFRERMERATSANALIREVIRSGEIYPIAAMFDRS